MVRGFESDDERRVFRDVGSVGSKEYSYSTSGGIDTSTANKLVQKGWLHRHGKTYSLTAKGMKTFVELHRGK
jgi:hypothetical protein